MKNSRRSVRLRGYDYSRAGAYFVTVCAQNRTCLFGGISDGQAVLNDAGMMIQTVWKELIIRFSQLELDACMVMPNHIHGILVLHGTGEHKVRPCARHGVRPCGTLPGSVGRVVQAFKSITTHKYIHGVKQHGWRRFDGKLWQRNYYEHVIRNDDEMNRVREYIFKNPVRWELDRDGRLRSECFDVPP